MSKKKGTLNKPYAKHTLYKPMFAIVKKANI